MKKTLREVENNRRSAKETRGSKLEKQTSIFFPTQLNLHILISYTFQTSLSLSRSLTVSFSLFIFHVTKIRIFRGTLLRKRDTRETIASVSASWDLFSPLQSALPLVAHCCCVYTLRYDESTTEST